MNEVLDQSQLIEQVKYIINSKDWYSHTESGSFKWEESVELMAETIKREIGLPINLNKIRYAIESSFDSECLIKAQLKPFVDYLLEIDSELVLWSVGDINWQEVKARKTGLLDRVGINFKFFNKNKIVGLKDIVLSLGSNSSPPICVVIIDDKSENLSSTIKLQNLFSADNLLIKTYHLDLKDDQADPAACIDFLHNLQDKCLVRDEEIKLIVDMDGVLIDTNRILLEAVAPKIVQMILE